MKIFSNKNDIIIALLLLCCVLFAICEGAFTEQNITFQKKEGTSQKTNGARGSITTFKCGNYQKDVYFYSPGTNDTVEIMLPTNINITKASMGLEGLPLTALLEREFSFNDTSNHSAWWGGIDISPPASPTSNYKINLYDGSDLVKLQNRDDNRINTGNIDGKYAYQMFSFSLPTTTNMSSIKTNWEGGGMGHPEMGFGTNGVKWYIYNSNAGQWNLIDDFHSGGVWEERALERTYSNNLGDLVDGNDDIHTMAVTRVGGAGMTTYMKTDFTNVEVTYDLNSFPANTNLNLDSMGQYEWEHPGTFHGYEILGDAHNIKGELQAIVDGGQGESVNISLSLHSTSPGIIRLDDLDIEYEVIVENQPPSIKNSFFTQNFNFPEDSNQGIGLIDLDEFFVDDKGVDNLTFSITTNHNELSASVNTTGHCIDFCAEKDFFGKREFTLMARDEEELFVESPPFAVSVTPTNDAPFFTTLSDSQISGEQKNITLNVSEGSIVALNYRLGDIDGDVPLVSIQDNMDLQECLYLIQDENDDFAGSLLVETDDKHIGCRNFSMVVNDGNGSIYNQLERKYLIHLNIFNTNDPPLIHEIEHMEVLQDEWLNFTVQAEDMDILYDQNETMTFTTNFSSSGIPVERWKFEGTNGHFSFKPDNSDVGTYHLNFSVKDAEGEVDSSNTTIDVLNRNDAPLVSDIIVNIVDAQKNTTEKENLTVKYSTSKASDPDLVHGDKLSYYWDFDRDDGIKVDAYGLNATHTYARAGNYTVTLTVEDHSGLTNSTHVFVVVRAPLGLVEGGETEKGENGKSENGEGEKDEYQDNSDAGVWLIILLIITTILGVIITIIIVRRGKGGAGAEGKNMNREEGNRQNGMGGEELDSFELKTNPIRTCTPAYPHDSPVSQHDSPVSQHDSPASPPASPVSQHASPVRPPTPSVSPPTTPLPPPP